MPTLKDYQNTDELNNPSRKVASDLMQGEHDAIEGYDRASDGLDDHPISAGVADATDSGQNIQKVNEGEQQPPDVADKYGWGDSKGSEKPQSRRARITGFAKKHSAGLGVTGGIIGVLVVFLGLTAPLMIMQQMISAFTGAFNDQLSAMEIRSAMLLKKKYDSKLTKNCTLNPLPCKYQTMREGSGLHKRLKAAGIEIQGDKSVVPGRIKPQTFTFNGGEPISADKLAEMASKDPKLKAALRKGYDPIYASFSDGNAAKVRTKLGLKRSSSVASSTDKDKMNEDLKKVAAGTDELPDDMKPLTRKESDGKVTYINDAGDVYSEEAGERINNQLAQSVGRAGLADKVAKSTIKQSVKSSLLITSMGVGAGDSLCSAWMLIRVAGFAAKYYQQRQLISYYFEFAKISHKQRFGDMTPEEMTFFADKLTSVNSEGKSALDSAGYRFAAYGDTFQPGNFAITEEKSGAAREAAAQKIMVQNETSRYVNGQLLNSNMMSTLVGAISENKSNAVDAADDICKFTKSWKGQALVYGAALVGVFVAVLTGGLSIGAGALITGAASLTIAVAMAVIQPKLIDMAKGEVIKGDENGNETGNALAAGAGGLNAQTAQERGLRPASKEAYAAYSEKSQLIASQFAEEERQNLSPFDTSSRHTFMGSIVFQLMPYVFKQQTIGTAGAGMLSFVGNTFATAGLGAKAKAATGDQYGQCDDPEYTGIAADPFCNLRYAVTQVEKDPEEVLQYMIDKNFIDPITAEPGQEYQDYIDLCITRQTSIGDKFTNYKDGTGDTGGDPGNECVIGRGGGNEERNAMFSLFYIDTSIEEGMENDFEDGAATSTTGAGATFRAATFNILHEPDNFGGCDWKCRLEASVNTMKDKQIDIAGLQEARPDQQKLLKSAKYGGDVYDIYPQTATTGLGPDQNRDSAVLWDKSKFALVEGKQKPIKYNGGNRKVNIVKLKYIEDGADGPQLYVLNTHDPIDAQSEAGGGPQNRKDNNELYYSTIKDELTDAPVVFTGDFNSKFTVEASANKPLGNDRNNLAYCILTRDNLLTHVSDAQEGKTGCESTQDVLGRNDVDHIFISPTMTASGYSIAKRNNKATNTLNNGGDHDMVYADLEIPGGAASTGAGSTFVIGTYNQKRALSENHHENAVRNIVNNGMDVVGTQETTNPKFNRYKALLSDSNYGVYPNQSGPNQTCSSAQAIFFNKAKFKLVRGEYFEIPRYPDPAVDCGGGEKTTASHNEAGLPKVWTHIPIIWLEDVGTGQTVIVMNAHNVANVKGAAGTQPAKSRYRANQIFVEQVKRLKSDNPGIPIFFTGDFNEGTNVRTEGNITYQGKQSNLLFCMFAENGLMKSADGPAMKCDPKYSIGTVDYIYVTPEVKIDWTKEIDSGGKDSGPPSYTDHPVRYAQVTVPSSETGGAGAVGGQVIGDDYAAECAKTIGASNCTGQCVAFVKFRLVKHGVISVQPLGDGGDVTSTLRGLGFKVDTTPAVNSVMSLRHNSTGHAAMVSKVNADGSIVVEEYNWPDGLKYGSRTISKATLDRYRNYPGGSIVSFAHTETKYK